MEIDVPRPLVNAVVRRMGMKREAAMPDPEAYALWESRRDIVVPHTPPRAAVRACTVNVREHAGWPSYDVRPRRRVSRAAIVYIHGGGYIGEISPFHWYLIGALLRPTGASAIVPIYPLAPTGSAESTVPEVADLIAEVIAERGAEHVIVMGDSAGGGLAVAAAMHLRDTGRVLPHRLVLISPWLDVTSSDPRIREIEPRDAMLAYPGLIRAGKGWAGGIEVTDPRVSPLYGELAGLPPMTVFTGTNDLLHPDALNFADKAAAVGSLDVDLHIEPGAQHVYPLMPVREGRRARRLMVELLRSVG